MNFKSEINIKLITLSIFTVIFLTLNFSCSENTSRDQANNTEASSSTAKEETKKDKILKKYDDLERDYIATIEEVDKVLKGNNINLSILKENLLQILETIKEEKELIQKSDIDSVGLSAERKAEQLNELLTMSKEVLAERMIELKEKDSKLTIDNRKLYNKLKKSIYLFEEEKVRNIELNDKIGQIKEKIIELEEEEKQNRREIKALKRNLTMLERELKQSNDMLKLQSSQISEMGEIIQKANVDCYYVYKQGDKVEEAKIYLTSQGIPEKYVQYFIRKKPDIYVRFKIPRDVYAMGVDKVVLKLYNALGQEIYSVSKTLHSEDVKIIIPNKNYLPGKYSIVILAGSENLLLDDKYWMKIAQ